MGNAAQGETLRPGASVRIKHPGSVLSGFTATVVDVSEEAGLCQIQINRDDWVKFNPRKGRRKPPSKSVIGLWYRPFGQLLVIPGQNKDRHDSEAAPPPEPVETQAKDLGSHVQALVWAVEDLTTACRELIARLEKVSAIAKEVLKGTPSG